MPFQQSPVGCVYLFVVCERVEKRGHNLKPTNESRFIKQPLCRMYFCLD